MTVHESEVVFNAAKGHTHDGEDSALIHIGDGVIELYNLSPDLVDWILDTINGSTEGAAAGSVSVSTGGSAELLPDLNFTTESLAPGESETGSITWATAALVCAVGIDHSDDTLCDLTFYHTDAYTELVKEFKVVDSTDRFLWEGVWAHNDDEGGGKIHYRVQNTGDTESTFSVTLRSATMVANEVSGGDSNPACHEVYVYSNLGGDPGGLAFQGRMGEALTEIDGDDLVLVTTAPKVIDITCLFRISIVTDDDVTLVAYVSGADGLYLGGNTLSKVGTGEYAMTSVLKLGQFTGEPSGQHLRPRIDLLSGPTGVGAECTVDCNIAITAWTGAS